MEEEQRSGEERTNMRSEAREAERLKLSKGESRVE
jgi:hypothetical protein